MQHITLKELAKLTTILNEIRETIEANGFIIPASVYESIDNSVDAGMDIMNNTNTSSCGSDNCGCK